jgi:hypothetical protein
MSFESALSVGYGKHETRRAIGEARRDISRGNEFNRPVDDQCLIAAQSNRSIPQSPRCALKDGQLGPDTAKIGQDANLKKVGFVEQVRSPGS